MKLGIVAPSETELRPFLDLCEVTEEFSKHGMRFFNVRHSDKEAVCVICGICKTNAACATQSLIDNCGVTHVFLIGVCGAISPRLKVNDTIVCTTVAHHDVDGKMLTENEPFFDSAFFNCSSQLLKAVQIAEMNGIVGARLFYGKEVTGEAFIDQDGREEIIKRHQPYGVDMETAAVAQVCALNSVPFLAFRTVTDTPDQSGLEVFRENVCKASRTSAFVLHETLKQL